MIKHTMVVSDVHLATNVDVSKTWLRYRQADRLSDEYLARMLDSARSYVQKQGGLLEIVINGDFLDPDAAPATSECRSEPEAARIVSQILIEHPKIVRSLQEVLTAGHRIILVPGNHDSQIAFPLVRTEILRQLPGVLFKKWFHRTTDGIHVEHGHQYDPLCVMERMFPMQGWLEDTVSSVSWRSLPGMFGTIDPYSLKMISLPILLTSMTACPDPFNAKMLDCVRDLLLMGQQDDVEAKNNIWLSQVSEETLVPVSILLTHQQLQARKAKLHDLAPLVRDYDRKTVELLRRAMKDISNLHGARAVVMGHTHEPFIVAHEGIILANSGTWAPVDNDERPVGSFVWLTSNNGVLRGALHHMWRSGELS